MILEHLAEISRENREYWEAQSQFKREWEDQLRKEELEEEIQAHGIGKFLEQVTKDYRDLGWEEGAADKMREIVANMLQKGLEVSLISEVTDLSVDYVERLKKNL